MHPEPCLPSKMSLDTVSDLKKVKDNYVIWKRNALMTVKLYLELPETPGRPLSKIPSTSILLFCKLYDPIKRQLTHISHMHVCKCKHFHSTFSRMVKMVDLEGKDVVGYEEIKFDLSVLCREMPEHSTPKQVRHWRPPAVHRVMWLVPYTSSLSFLEVLIWC